MYVATVVRYLLRTLVLGALLVTAGCGGEDSDVAVVDDRPGGAFEVSGMILEAARQAHVVLVQDEDGRVWSVSTARSPVVIREDGRTGVTRDLLPGLSVALSGQRFGADSVRPDTIRVTEAPPILLTHPRPIALPSPVITVAGYSEMGRNARYRILDGDEPVLEGTIRAEALGVARYGSFSGTVSLAAHRPQNDLTLEVWPEGADVDQATRRPLRFAPERVITLYYPSRIADPGWLRCEGVYPVQRRVPVHLPPEEAVRMLIHGLDRDEMRRGYFSALGSFPGVRSIEIHEETARVDLETAAEAAALDACTVTAAEAQVRRTLVENFGLELRALTVGGSRLRAAPAR
jgi:hypothetical protein